jgi:hypothetical protein
MALTVVSSFIALKGKTHVNSSGISMHLDITYEFECKSIKTKDVL